MQTILINPYSFTASFSPDQVSGLVGWYKADSLALSDGDPLTTWTDLSTSAKNLTQATTSQKPTYKTNVVNGQPAILFDGTDDYLVASSSITLGHVFVVAKYRISQFDSYDGLITGTSDVSSQYVMIGEAGTAGKNSWHNSAMSQSYRYNGVDKTENSTDMTAPMTTFGLCSMAITGTVSLTLRAGLWAGGPGYWDGHIAEIVVYNTVLSSTDRNNVEGYLRTKYNLY